jgi:Arc/MetJ family transcription regulator
MATNLAIDEQLLNNALEIGGLRTKKDTVNTALEEFIQRRKAEDVINLFGQIEFDENYDYKKMRSRFSY